LCGLITYWTHVLSWLSPRDGFWRTDWHARQLMDLPPEEWKTFKL